MYLNCIYKKSYQCPWDIGSIRPFLKTGVFLYFIISSEKKVAENERLNILALPEVQSDIIHFLLYTYFLKDIVHSCYALTAFFFFSTDDMFFFFAGSTR